MTNQEAIEDIRKNIKPIVGGKSLDMAIEALEERKTGLWINRPDDIPNCSECGYIPEFNRYIDDYYYSDYCPNCGAKMEVEHEQTQV